MNTKKTSKESPKLKIDPEGYQMFLDNINNPKAEPTEIPVEFLLKVDRSFGFNKLNDDGSLKNF